MRSVYRKSSHFVRIETKGRYLGPFLLTVPRSDHTFRVTSLLSLQWIRRPPQ